MRNSRAGWISTPRSEHHRANDASAGSGAAAAVASAVDDALGRLDDAPDAPGGARFLGAMCRACGVSRAQKDDARLWTVDPRATRCGLGRAPRPRCGDARTVGMATTK